MFVSEDGHEIPQAASVVGIHSLMGSGTQGSTPCFSLCLGGGYLHDQNAIAFACVCPDVSPCNRCAGMCVYVQVSMHMYAHA